MVREANIVRFYRNGIPIERAWLIGIRFPFYRFSLDRNTFSWQIAYIERRWSQLWRIPSIITTNHRKRFSIRSISNRNFMRTIWCPCHSIRCKCRQNGVVPTCLLAMKICIMQMASMWAIRTVACITIRHSSSSSTSIRMAWCWQIIIWPVAAPVVGKDTLRTRSVHTIMLYRHQPNSHDSTTMLKHRNSSKPYHWYRPIWWIYRNKIHRPIHHSS